MVERVEQISWPGGIDNLSRREKIKDGCVRDALNVTPTNGGTFTLRPDAELIAPGTRIRGVVSLGHDVLYADGEALMKLDTRTNTATQIGSIPPLGAFVGSELNSELFLFTETQCLRYKAGVLRRWGVPECRFSVATSTGTLRAGVYRVACVHVNPEGEEGGVIAPAIINVQDGGGLDISCTVELGYVARVYVSTADGETLYLQGEIAGALSIGSIRDDMARLFTVGEVEPRPGQLVVDVGGSLACASGSFLWLTSPMRPHARSASSRFFQYSKPITTLLSTGAGLFVSADKTYFLSGIESAQPVQAEVFPYPALSGSGVKLADGRVAWMTPFGLAVGAADGSAVLVSSDRFAPSGADSGASGAINLDGNQLVVTAMSGRREENPLIAKDFYEVEIVS